MELSYLYWIGYSIKAVEGGIHLFNCATSVDIRFFSEYASHKTPVWIIPLVNQCMAEVIMSSLGEEGEALSASVHYKQGRVFNTVKYMSI